MLQGTDQMPLWITVARLHKFIIEYLEKITLRCSGTIDHSSVNIYIGLIKGSLKLSCLCTEDHKYEILDTLDIKIINRKCKEVGFIITGGSITRTFKQEYTFKLLYKKTEET